MVFYYFFLVCPYWWSWLSDGAGQSFSEAMRHLVLFFAGSFLGVNILELKKKKRMSSFAGSVCRTLTPIQFHCHRPRRSERSFPRQLIWLPRLRPVHDSEGPAPGAGVVLGPSGYEEDARGAALGAGDGWGGGRVGGLGPQSLHQTPLEARLVFQGSSSFQNSPAFKASF